MNENNNIPELLQQAWAERNAGNFEEAQRYLHKVKDQCRRDDFLYLGRMYQTHMQIYMDQNDYKKAIEFCNLAIDSYESGSDQKRVLHAKRHLADIHTALKNYKIAEDLYCNILSQADVIGFREMDYANCLRSYGVLLSKTKQVEKGITIWTTAKSIYKEYNIAAGVQEADDHLNLLNQY